MEGNAGGQVRLWRPPHAQTLLIKDFKEPRICPVQHDNMHAPVHYRLLKSNSQLCRYERKLEFFVSSHLQASNGIKHTPKGLTFVGEWGTLSHAAGAAAIIALYARGMDSMGEMSKSKGAKLFAEKQVKFPHFQRLVKMITDCAPFTRYLCAEDTL